MQTRAGIWAFAAAGLLATACVARSDESTNAGDDAFSSGIATLMDLEFDGELTSTIGTNTSGQVPSNPIKV